MAISNHYSKDRQYREKVIRSIGEGKTLREFYLDKGHKNGAEIHCLTTTGIVIVYNARTMKLCTKLVARAKQIERYYEKIGQKAPEYLLKMAREHEALGYNK